MPVLLIALNIYWIQNITLKQRLPIPVLAQVNTPDSDNSSSEESYVHEMCSDWYDPYTVFIAPYSLSRGNLLKFTSFRNIHSWICAAPLPATSSHTDKCDITYCTSVNKYNSNSRFAHFNALWMEHIHIVSNWNHGGISGDVHFAGHLRSNRATSYVIRDTYEICRAGGCEDWDWETLL